MKKYLLLAFSTTFLFSVNAQDRDESIYMDMDASYLAEIDQEPTVLLKKIVIPNNKSASVEVLGTSYNVYSILLDKPNQVAYNKDINTVTFVHRQESGGSGGSGIISFDYSTDGGATWTINPFQTTPTGSGSDWGGNRYPNTGIYNPAGNTDPTKAFMVQAGPAREGGGWSKTFRSSFKLDGSLLDETYDANSVDSLSKFNEYGAAGLYVTSRGTAWYVSTNYTATDTRKRQDKYSKYFIVRGDYNAANANFDWTTVDTITPAWNPGTTSEGIRFNYTGLPNMAWSPDGMTGYVVIMGSWGANTMKRPYVIKTTDAGTTWNNVNDYDFSLDPVMNQLIHETKYAPTVKRPLFDSFSFDVVVGKDDELRIFTKVHSGSSNHIDSINYSFTAKERKFLFEVATNETGWDVTFVDSIYVDDYEWDAISGLKHYVRPQASRSQDGSKVFYSWLGSPAILSDGDKRSYPDVWAVGHDIEGTEPMPWSAYKVLSANTDAELKAAYQTVAVDVIENGNDHSWELPLVYATGVGGSAITKGADPAQWNFLKGVGFSPVDFTAAAGGNAGGEGSHNFAVVVDPSGIEESFLTDEHITLFPNPSNGIITLQVSNTKEFNYTIVDVVGNTIKTNHINGNKTIIDLQNNAKGIYFANINNGSNTITKKVVLN